MSPLITVVGSFAVGLTMKVDRFPSSGETLLGTGYRTDHGGKGSNQAVGCARLGASVRFVACIGADAFGAKALELHKRENVETAWVRQEPDSPTGVGFILVQSGSGENRIVLDPGANGRLTAKVVAESSAAFHESRVVLTQLETPVEAAMEALALARARGAITILNPAPARPLAPAVLEQADVLTPNETEAKVLLGYDPQMEISADELARQLRARGSKQVVVTLGAAGAVIATSTEETWIPAIEARALDTTGAGDAFNAGLAVALANGADLESAVRFAVVTGGLAVTREGVIPSLPHRADVLACLAARRLPVPGWFRA